MKNYYLLIILASFLCNFTELLGENIHYVSCSVIEQNVLHKITPTKEEQKFIQNGKVSYSDFGAKGDGISDDIDAIAATHEFANQHNLEVVADSGATYYIGGKDQTVNILTDTDFGSASFIIDDTDVENRNAHIFSVNSILKPFKPENITSLKRFQNKIDVSLPGSGIVVVNDSNVKRYIRFGPNQNDGSSQTDLFVVDKNGNVDGNTPVIWDFNHITDITILPIDEKQLKITGGHFTTLANRDESKYTYYARGISINRSNVLVEGLVQDRKSVV